MGENHILFIEEKIISLPSPIPLNDEDKQAKIAVFKQLLRGVKFIVAPMVDQSELAFRMLMRDHKADLCFSPMIHAHLFVTDHSYRRTVFTSCLADRPLIVQFCANDADILLSACRIVESFCDAVDLNLGCPQLIARRGHYGAYLQASLFIEFFKDETLPILPLFEDDIPLICHMISHIHTYCKVPISCKIRILNDINSTVTYARNLENAGACMLTVHGRTREQRGPHTGLADWNAIRIVKESVGIPVIANGNIQSCNDIDQCLLVTKADAILSAGGILSNPYLFEGIHMLNWIVALEYLNYAELYDAGCTSIRAHIFRICHHSLLEFVDLRKKLPRISIMKEFQLLVEEIGSRVTTECPDYLDSVINKRHLCHPSNFKPWICQPCYRALSLVNGSSDSNYRLWKKSMLDMLSKETGLSKRRVQKLERRKVIIDFIANKFV